MAQKDERVPKRYYIWGDTGTGKTLFAKTLSEKMGSKMYVKNLNKAWINYNKEKVVLLEVNTREQWKYIRNQLGKWLDYYEFESGEVIDKMTKEVVKSGVMIDAREYDFVITSYHPIEYFLDNEKVDESLGHLCDFEVDKIKRLIEVHEMHNRDIKAIRKEIDEILK